jgi:hypothetical protein
MVGSNPGAAGRIDGAALKGADTVCGKTPSLGAPRQITTATTATAEIATATNHRRLRRGGGWPVVFERLKWRCFIS